MTQKWTMQNERQFTATVFIVSQEKPTRIVFLHHKKLGFWLPPGGHIEANENPIEAAIREAREETGIDISPFIDKLKIIDHRAKSVPLPYAIIEEYIDAHGQVPEHYHVDLIYKVVLPAQELVLLEKEHHDVGWFTQQEFAKLATFKNVADLAAGIYK